MPTNYLTQFATSGTANLPVESTWQNLTERATGFQTGLARSSYFNRLFAQGANAAYVLGEFVVDYAAQDADLDGASLYTNFKTALNGYIGGSFLPLSGGLMTGAIRRSGKAVQGTGTTDYTLFTGGTGTGDGAYVYIYAKDHASYAGQIRATAYDGTNSCLLIIRPDGGIWATSSANHLTFGKGTYTVTNIRASGYLSGNATSMVLYVPLQVVGTIDPDDLTELKATVRVGTGGYTSPGSISESIIPTGVTKAVNVRDGAINVSLTKSAGWGQPTNTTVIAQISSITFTVT